MRICAPLQYASAAVLAGFLCSAPVQAASVVGGTLLSGSDANQIETWLQATPGLSYSGGVTLTNIFNNFSGQGPSEFHAAADGQGPTIAVMRVTPLFTDNGPQLIGGFNPQSWSTNYYNLTPDNADRTAFIYNLTSDTILRQQTANSDGQFQTYNRDYAGPIFGAPYDIFSEVVFGSGGSVFPKSYCVDPTTSCYVVGPNVLGGTGYQQFTLGQFEVYTVSAAAVATPVPAALPLFASGLGLLAWGARRKKKSAAAA